jgi:hypothetical protein
VQAPLWDFLSPTVFCARKMLRIFLIGLKKPSVTLNVMRHILKIFGTKNNIKKQYEKNIRNIFAYSFK